jgi:hypothetical protein
MKDNKWLRLLSYVTGLINQEVFLQNEYWPPKTRSCAHTCQPACVCQIRRGPRSPRSVSDSGAGRWRKWPVWPNQTPSWPGTECSLPRSSMGRKTVAIPVGRESTARLRRWLFKWPARTRAGGTIGSRERWPTSGIACQTKRSETSCGGTALHRHRNGAKTRPGGNSLRHTWQSFWHRLLHGRCAHLARAGDLLRSVFSFTWKAGG